MARIGHQPNAPFGNRFDPGIAIRKPENRIAVRIIMGACSATTDGRSASRAGPWLPRSLEQFSQSVLRRHGTGVRMRTDGARRRAEPGAD